MPSVEEMLLSQLLEIKKEMKRLVVEKNKIKAALQAVKDVATQNNGTKAGGSGDLTFKQKIKIALSEKFPHGASASDILEYCNSRWPEQQIMRSSLSPQLSRLKTDGVIDLEGKLWVLKEQKSDPFDDFEPIQEEEEMPF